jgi:hypothetical protein
LIHRTLLEASARLTPERFEGFCDSVILKGSKRGKFRLKQELRAALEGPRPQSLALALWEEPQPLTTRDEDALQMLNETSRTVVPVLDEPSRTVVPVQEPADWLGPLCNPLPVLNVKVGSIIGFLILNLFVSRHVSPTYVGRTCKSAEFLEVFCFSLGERHMEKPFAICFCEKQANIA